jgi:3-oxoacyl-[acyl-carrier protein] reductase
MAVQSDVAQEADVRRLFAEAKKAFGRVDVLVNNAGVYEFLPLENVTADHFHRQFNLNALGLLLATQEAVKQFGSGGGSVINISSVVATAAPPQGPVYSATKAAVDAVTRSLAKERGPRRVRVNSINPGMMETEGTHGQGITDGELRRQVEAQAPLGRIGQPADVAPAVAFLASDEAGWITGETWHVAGGFR